MARIPKREVLATHDFSGFKRRLLPQLSDIATCGKVCESENDCTDCWVCCKCSNEPLTNFNTCYIV